MSYRTRFAPSPNGPLHLGHAYAAFMVARRAQEMGGIWLLRHEDIDQNRCPPENAHAIEEDLAWLGLKWHGAPIFQSARIASHTAALRRLEEGGFVYPCFATRGEIRMAVANVPDWPSDPDGSPLYPELHKRMSGTERDARMKRGEPFALRLDMEKAQAAAGLSLDFTENGEGPRGERGAVAVQPEAWGDVVLARKDIATSYHMAVVVDDAMDGITEVVRGQDLFDATGLHRLLQVLLGLPEPQYFHHRLILGEDGRKLSKSEGAAALFDWRARGASPADVRAALGLQDPMAQSQNE